MGGYEDFKAALNPLCTQLWWHATRALMQLHHWGVGLFKENRSAVCGGFLSLFGYKPLLGGNKKCVHVKETLPLSSAANFKQALGSSKHCLISMSFLKSLFEKNSHWKRFVFRCLWRHYLKSILNDFFLFSFMGYELSVEFRFCPSPAVESLRGTPVTKWISVCFYIFHICCFWQNMTHQIKCVFQREILYQVIVLIT